MEGSSSKRHRAVSPPSSPPTLLSTDERYFANSQSYADFIRSCDNRTVSIERKFDENFLRSINFKYVDRLKRWNWWNLISLSGDVLADVVRVFYFRGDAVIYDDNGLPTEDRYEDQFRTYLLGENFKMTVNKLRCVLGEIIIGSNEWEMPNNFDMIEACKTVYENDQLAAYISDTNLMSLDNRILHLMVAQTFHPRGGNYATAFQEEIWIMYRIIQGNPPNLYGLIMRKMLAAISWCKLESNNFWLPYGKLVTMICRAKLDFNDNEKVETRKGMGPLKRASIMAMGFREDRVTKMWHRVRKEQTEPTTEAGSSSQQNLDMASLMQNLNTIHEATMTRIDNRFNKVMSFQHSLQEQIHYLNNNLDDVRRASNLPPFPGPYPFYQPPPQP